MSDGTAARLPGTPTLYLTQLIYVVPGEESAFLDFEAVALPLMREYEGHLLYRIRAPQDAFIDLAGEPPYEVHILSFPSRRHVDEFLQDERRAALLHLKQRSVRSSLLIQGQLV